MPGLRNCNRERATAVFGKIEPGTTKLHVAGSGSLAMILLPRSIYWKMKCSKSQIKPKKYHQSSEYSRLDAANRNGSSLLSYPAQSPLFNTPTHQHPLCP